MRVLKKCMKGSVTIEYTLLLPILMVVYTFLVVVALFQYNQCLLETNLYLIGNQGMELARQDGEGRITVLKSKAARLYQEKYIMVEDVRTMYSVKGNHVEIVATGKIRNPLNFIGLGEEVWELYAKCEQEVLDTTSILRLYKNIRDRLQSQIQKEE
jgi:hypothetical protein